MRVRACHRPADSELRTRATELRTPDDDSAVAAVAMQRVAASRAATTAATRAAAAPARAAASSGERLSKAVDTMSAAWPASAAPCQIRPRQRRH